MDGLAANIMNEPLRFTPKAEGPTHVPTSTTNAAAAPSAETTVASSEPPSRRRKGDVNADKTGEKEKDKKEKKNRRLS